jgi:predicted phosphoribosyltransferase
MTPFRNRRDAGKKLAATLSTYRGRSDAVVLALPRGGVPVGYEVAHALNAPLDVFMVRKLGVPGREELAFGAIASGGIRILNSDVIRMTGIPDEVIDFVARREREELTRRESLYRADRRFPQLMNHTIILVDDGLATGASMRAGIAGLRTLQPARIVVAVPVSAPEACESLRPNADEIVCAVTPDPFYGVGHWYEDFSQVTDEEVQVLLQEANRQLFVDESFTPMRSYE